MISVIVAKPSPNPIPLKCTRCGQVMDFYAERIDVDDDGRPDHVRVYFCLEHGFFHVSDRNQITAGL